MRRFAALLAPLALMSFSAETASADERYFTYIYDAGVLPEGVFELEQWVTNQNGRKDQDYSAWNLRTEFEYGLTERLQGALYLNLDSVRSETAEESETETKFKGVSTEFIYQLLNPNLDPVGLAAYFEATSDGLDYELEGKLLVSKPVGDWNFAFNAVYEAEWEREHSTTEEEAELQFLAGASYKLTPSWAVGLELRNKSAYPDGVNLSGQEYNTWSVGPNIHYGAPKWWATFTVLPQVWGDGDGASGNLQRVHEESFEARLIVGWLF